MTPNPPRGSGSDPIKLAQQQLRTLDEQKRYDKQSAETLRQVSDSLREFLSQFRQSGPARAPDTFRVSAPVAIPGVVSPQAAQAVRPPDTYRAPAREPSPDTYRVLPDEPSHDPRMPLAHTPPRGVYDLAPDGDGKPAAPAPAATRSDPCQCIADALRPLVTALAAMRLPAPAALAIAAPGGTGAAELPSPSAPTERPGGTGGGTVPSGFQAALVQASEVLQAFARSIPLVGSSLSQMVGGVRQTLASVPFAELLQGYRDTLGGLSSLAKGLTDLLPGFSTLKTALSSLAQSAGSRVATAAKAIGRGVGGVVGKGVGLLRSAGQRVASLLPQRAKNALREAGGKAGAALGRAGKGVVSTGKAAAGAVAGLASGVGAVVSAFKELANVATGFVSALNPSAVMMFQRAMHDLNAVVGVALQPVLQAAAGIVKEFSATLFPIAQGLAPVVGKVMSMFSQVAKVGIEQFGKLAETMMPLLEAFVELMAALQPLVDVALTIGEAFASMLKPIIAVLVGIVQALATPLKMIADLLAGLAPLLQAFSVVMAGVAEGIKALFGSIASALGLGDLKNAFGGLRETIGTFSKYLLLAVAHVAKAFGANSVVAGMVQALEGVKKKDATGLGVIQSAQFTDFGEFGKQVALASLRAGPEAVQDDKAKEEQWRQETLAELKKLQEGQKTVVEKAAEKVSETIQKETRSILNEITGGAYDAVKGAIAAGKVGIKFATTGISRAAGVLGIGSGG